MLRAEFFETIRQKLDKIDKTTLQSLMSDIFEDFDIMRTALNSMTEGILVTDNDRKVYFANKMAIKNLHIKTASISNEPLENVVGDKNVINTIEQALQNEEKLTELELRTENDEYISLSVHPLVKKSAIIGSIIISQDITLDKENEKKLQRAENLAAVSTISAGIAHEIKNPLSAISIHVQLLQDQVKACKCENSDDMKYCLNVVNDEINRLSDIVNNFLFAVRPITPTLMPMKFNDFLDKFVRFISPEVKEKNILLVKSYSDLPEVLLDEKIFKQAVLNLTENSIAAVKDTDNPTIELEAYTRDDYVILNVIDNGQGIPEEVQSKIFNPYFTTKSNGTGLGLAILYKIIKEHNGEISFTSQPEHTVFTVRLPITFRQSNLLEE